MRGRRPELARARRRQNASRWPARAWRRSGDLYQRAGREPNPDVTVAQIQRRFPTSLAEWDTYFPGLPDPIAIWTFQESASPIDDKVGAKDFSQNAAVLYQRTGDTEPTESPRYAVELDTANTSEWIGVTGDTTFGDIAVGGSMMMLIRFRCPTGGGALKGLAGKGTTAAGARWALRVNTSDGLTLSVGDGTASYTLATSGVYADNAYHDVCFGVDSVADKGRIITESQDANSALTAGIVTTIDASGLAPAGALRFGSVMNTVPIVGAQISYAALFNAVFTAANLATFRQEM